MPFLIYIAIALVTVFGVMVEMDVLVEPSRHIERAAIQAQQSLPPMLPSSALRAQAKKAGAEAGRVRTKRPRPIRRPYSPKPRRQKSSTRRPRQP